MSLDLTSELKDENSASLRERGQAALLAGRAADARALLVRAQTIEPHVLTCAMLASASQSLGNSIEAAQWLSRGIDLVGEEPGALFILGGLAELLDDMTRAHALFMRCLTLDPAHARARHRAGLCALKLGRAEDAVAQITRGLEGQAADADRLADLSAALCACGRFAEAEAAATTALGVDASALQALNNLGFALMQQNRSVEASAVYARAAVLAPGNPAVRFGQAIAWLKAGRFDLGWPAYEWRWRDCQRPRQDLCAPLWQGEALKGRTILVHAEQGLGDSLQFIRFAPLLAHLGARVLVQVPQALVRLVAAIDGVAHAFSVLDASCQYDVHVPMASLPGFFEARPGHVPVAPYLSAPSGPMQARATALRARLGGGGQSPDLVVGLVWSGNPRAHDPKWNLVDRRRSVSLAQLAPLLNIEGVKFASFQFGAQRHDLAECAGSLVDAMEDVEDFADTAALLGAVDLLISVDTSIVHLQGALGKPVWMLGRHDGCWRWLEEETTSFWYPSLRIIRQPAPGDWASAVAETAGLLRQWVGAYRSLAHAA